MVRKKLLSICICVLIVGAGSFVLLRDRGEGESIHNASTTRTMSIGGVELSVLIASTTDERVRGLSGRTSLGADGMFFRFERADYHGMWMKDMHFPIDIVWIGTEGTVVGIEENVPPESYPKVFSSPRPALYALEMNAHGARTFGIETSDIVVLPE